MNAPIHESAGQPTGQRARRRWVWTTLCCLTIVVGGWLAYSDSFGGPFIFDDSGLRAWSA